MNDTDTSERPKWLLELENRKRKPRLAHEAGAGAPCVLCKSACPGLDLHFWRKICKNCKCSKDDHDVDDEDFLQFDLLLGTSRRRKKPILLRVLKGDKEEAEEAFEWIPPDATKELAADYMKALPLEKLPIKGSPGAALRRQLLQKQLPLHDIDYKTCDELTDQERKQFEKYVENIKKYAGQGIVTKILTPRPYDASSLLMTPANATDMQRLSPQNKANAPSTLVHLRTPSSFTPKCLYKKSLPRRENIEEQELSVAPSGMSSTFEKYSAAVDNTGNIGNIGNIGNNGNVVKSELGACESYGESYGQRVEPPLVASVEIVGNDRHARKGVQTSENALVPSRTTTVAERYKQAYRDVLKNPTTALSYSATINDNADAAEAILADALLPPSRVNANDIIGSTLDEEGLRFIREKLANKYSKQENACSRTCDKPGFAKNSGTANASRASTVIDNPGLITGETEVGKFGSNTVQSSPVDSIRAKRSSPLDVSSSKARSQPFGGIDNRQQAELTRFATPSTVLCSKDLEKQVFPCEPIGPAATTTTGQSKGDRANAENLKRAMEELRVGGATNAPMCHKCDEEIRVGDVAIITEKAKNAAWHPGCFVCDTCNELLVDLVYFYYKNKLYCARDLATLLGIPRCFACDELIFVREYTVAEGHNYHVKHFCCWDCDTPLAGKQYITENDRPLCLLCYQKSYAKTCKTCQKVIAADQQGVAVKDFNFHATEECFRCYVCDTNLLNGRFAVKENQIFCSKECIFKFLNS